MKCNVIIDPSREEEIIIYAHAPSALTEAVTRLAEEQPAGLIGYRENSIIPIDPEEVVCFAVEENKVYAYLPKERLQMKYRLYQLEEQLLGQFIKINQSCIANVKKIRRFDVSFAGALQVVFEGGHTDYVSRRQLKTVKERFGIL